jgi:hypothetical protein
MSILERHAELLKVCVVRSRSERVDHPECIELFAANKRARFFIDYEDEDLSLYSWLLTNGYPARRCSRRSTTPNKVFYLHTLVLERKLGRMLEPGELCDHADGNKFNNRRFNLRVATRFENAYNTKAHRDSQSKYKGVTRSGGQYRMQIQYSVQVCEYLSTEEDAARRYDEYAAKHHGRFAVFNFPDEWVYDSGSKSWTQR